MVNPDSAPSAPISDEVGLHTFTEAVNAADWDGRFSANFAELRAVQEELGGATDPSDVLTLIEARRATVVATIGSGAITLFKRDLAAERAAFDTQFGGQL